MSKIKGPKNGVLKLNFNGQAKTMPGSKKALMLLSIKNNELCTGEFLDLSIKQATNTADKDNKIIFLTLLIADEIYWHNLAKSAEDSVNNRGELKVEALRLGEEYFKNNFYAFLSPFNETIRAELLHTCENKTVDQQIFIINEMASTLPIPFEIKRWASWVDQKTLTGSPYKDIQKDMEELYQKKEKSLIDSIETTAITFAKRHAKEADPSLLLHRSRGYLIEESPAVMWLGAQLGYNFVIYAGGIIPSFSATKDFFVVDAKNQESTKRPFAIAVENPKNLVNWLEAHYKRVAHKVAEKVIPAEISAIAPPSPGIKITPVLAFSSVHSLTTSDFGMFPPNLSSKERRKSKHVSLPMIYSDKNTPKKEEELNPTMLKAITLIAETFTALRTEQERLIVFEAVFAEFICASKKAQGQREFSNPLRMS